MRRCLHAFALLLSVSVTAEARPMRFVGDHNGDAAKVLVRGGIDRGDTRGVASDSLISLLVAEGYLDAEIHVEGDTVTIVVGPRLRFSQLIVNGDSTAARIVGGYFTRAALREALEELVAEYVVRGFRFAGAKVRALARDKDTITALVDLNEGPLVRLSRLEFEGLVRTKERTICAEFAARAGDTLSERSLVDIEQTAQRLAYVRFLGPVEVRPMAGYEEAELVLHFKEREQVNLFGGVGYQDERNEGLLWNLSLELPNLFGEGKRLRLQTERRQKERNLLLIAYAQPTGWLGRSVLSGEVATRDYRDQFYEFATVVGIETYPARLNVAGLKAGWKRVEPNDSAGYSRYDLRLEFGRNDVVEQRNPRTGYAIRSAVAYAYRVVDADSTTSSRSYNETRAELSVTLYRSLSRQVVMATRLGYQGIESTDEQLPFSELFLFGGPGTLRGYRNEQFEVRRGIFASVEPRYRFGGGFLFGFWDAAFMQSPVAGDLSELYRQGFGGGIGLMSDNTDVQLSLGWNPESGIDQPYLSVTFHSGL